MNESKKSEAKLLKICREAQSFTQMINSMQQSQDYNETRANDISKEDLMRGAFDLQESLITLKKMSSKNEVLDLDTSKGSSRFEKLAMNGSLFSYIEELKNVIKESSLSGRQEISHNVNVNNLSSSSLGSLMKKERSPSLIAKLMGLEDFPSETEERTIVENQNLGLKRVKDVVENCNEAVESYETKKQDEGPSNFPNKMLVQNPQSNNTFISTKKFSRKLERKKVFDNVRNKIISNQKPVKCIPDKKETGNKIVSKANGKSNASSKLVAKDLKSNAASSCRVLTKYNRSIARKITKANDDHIEAKKTDALQKKNQTADSWKLQNVSSPVKAKNMVKKQPVKNSMYVKSMTRSPNCKEVNVCITAKQIKHHSYIRGHNTEVMVKCSKAIKTTTSNDITTAKRNAKVKVDVRILLLNSENFIMNAQELYGISCHQNKNQISLRTREVKLIIDCANEFMVRKKHQIELSKKFSGITCLGQMVDEISHGIENLNGYRTQKAGLSSIESVYVWMEKDIRCKQRMIDAIWDYGWANMSCVEEVDIVAGDIEEFIVYWLLEEIVMEFFLM